MGIDLNVPATRLLVVAEPKMLNALANGLRVGGRFEIATAQFSEPGALESLIAQADVVALFYGSKQFPLVESLQALSQGIRSRGGQLIAVLQKDQAHHRDECLRAGASDLLFMPMPKDQFVARLSHEASARKISYALSGGPAADAMQHFYRGSEAPVFLDAENQRGLRLLPDRNGPVVLLKPFGNLVYWREFDGKMVAPPWLIYAELLIGSDPRAREAAEELRREFLK